MKIRSSSMIVGESFPGVSPRKLEVENAREEIPRVVKRLRSLLLPHFKSARHLGVILGPGDIRAVIDALLAEADGLNPESHLHCPEELRSYLRRTIFDELLGEPSNTLYTTRVSADLVRYEAMPADFWKDCLQALRARMDTDAEALQ